MGEGSPTKIDDRKQGTLTLTSLLEHLVTRRTAEKAQTPLLLPSRGARQRAAGVSGVAAGAVHGGGAACLALWIRFVTQTEGGGLGGFLGVLCFLAYSSVEVWGTRNLRAA